MLGRGTTARIVVLTLLAAGVAALSPTAASAHHEVYCPPLGGDCVVKAHDPGSPGDPGGPGGGGPGGGRTCPNDAPPTIGCWYGVYGWFIGDGCFAQLMSPQPPAGSPFWEGHGPGDGAVYEFYCGWPGLVAPFPTWRATPPPGFGGLPSPAELAAQAINQLPIHGPDIGIAPNPGGSGLVGMPVWMWTAVTPATWGPASATASVPGLSVTATAHAQKIVWSMGNGASVTCTTPGTPYKVEYGHRKSPDCGFDGYDKPSRPRYTVTGTTTWQVDWVGGGESGTLSVTRASTITIDIDELQVVTS
jgi:hypothetical protein